LAGGVLWALVVPAPGAQAQTTPAVARQAWAAQTSPLTFLPQADTLYVSARLGAEETRSFVELSASGPRDWAGASLVLVPSGDALLPESAHVAACHVIEPLSGEGMLADTGPGIDCRVRADVQIGDAGEWMVPLDAFTSAWAGAPPVLAVVAEPSSAAETWRVALDPSKSALRAPEVAASSDAAAPEEPVLTPDAGTEDAPFSPPRFAVAPTAPELAPAPAPSTGARAPADAARPRSGVPVVATSESAASPPFTGAVATLLLVGIGGLTVVSRRRPDAVELLPQVSPRVMWSAAGLGALALPLTLDEASLFKVGLVLITVIGALGLHVLVNWAGQLSLAHAAFVGVPAFVTAQISAEQGVSPIHLLPLAMLVGAAIAVLVGLPSLRARGLQVALVTLAAGVAVDRFLFTKTWLVGAGGGVATGEPRLGPVTFTTTRSLYGVVAVALTGAVVAMYLLYRSKLGRALLWVRGAPDAAAAAGIPVARFKLLAYALSGVFAGLAGNLTVVWVQRLAPQAFPLQLSFTFLLIVVLAGRGLVWGVVAAAAMLDGSPRFISGADAAIAYSGPIALIYTLTRNKAGLTGVGGALMQQMRELAKRMGPRPSSDGTTVGPLSTVGLALVVLGFAAIGIAWYHTGNTDQLWIQNQELLLGGFGGVAMVVAGVGALVIDRIRVAAAQLVRELRAVTDPADVSLRLVGRGAGDTDPEAVGR
jgi:branched-chain amino acid transport system permease protein